MKVHRLTPYNALLAVIVSNDTKKAITQLRKEFPGLEIDFHDKAAATTYDRVWIDNTTNSPCQLIIVILGPHGFNFDTIAHEATHVVNFCFNYHGVKLDQENDEPQAYLLGYVAQKIADQFKNFKFAKPKKK